ncbi:MAG: Hsp20/alpha crystallin family protein [ANME-2 cluster archaeon]|nr:Hsp20/alpha crystallin family protein [ANME-2 cluster archaeon]
MRDRRRRDMFEDIFEEMFEDMNEMLGNVLNSRLEAGESANGEPMVWGFSMTQRGDGPPEIREFGNVDLRPAFGLPDEMEAHLQQIEVGMRKPLIDIMEAEDSLHVVVEMPGVSKKDITLDSNGTTLDIKALTEDRKYSEHVELPAKVLPDSAEATYKNGVLEVIFQYDKSDKRSIKLR